MNSINAVSLKNYTTLHLDVNAKQLLSIKSIEDIIHFFDSSASVKETWMILGGGSNVLFVNDFDGTILHVQIPGKEIIREDESSVLVRFGAGENWHDCVKWAVERNYGGIENLALIPGTCGAAPVQNIGAYGVELKDVLQSVHGYNLIEKRIQQLSNKECEFGYRDSIFKRALKHRFFITHIDIRLTKQNGHVLNTSYKPLEEWLILNQIAPVTIYAIFEAVVAIRSSKLPNPDEIGNAGSFFKNPVVGLDLLQKIQSQFHEVPHYPYSENLVKIPAGWLIEKAGWKGYREGDVGVYPKQALVLVNYGNASGKDLLNLAQRIINSVFELFSITLEPEVNLII